MEKLEREAKQREKEAEEARILEEQRQKELEAAKLEAQVRS